MPSIQKNYAAISSIESLERFVDKLIADDLPVGFDLESGYDGPPFPKGSVNTEYGPSKVVGFSFTNSTDWARYVPLAHDIGQNLDCVEAAKLLWKLLTSTKVVAHNLGFERRFSRKFFKTYIPEIVVEFDGWFDGFSDTMIESYLHASQKEFGLKALTKSMYDHDQVELIDLFPDLLKKDKDTLRFNKLELTPEVISYACEDAAWCLALHEDFYPKVKDMFLYKIEMAIIPILNMMEKEDTGGLLFDWPAMAIVNQELQTFIEVYKNEVLNIFSEMTGEDQSTLNMGSPKQVSELLFDKLGFQPAKMTPTNKPSTDAKALAILKRRYPVIQRMLEYRELVKMSGSYLEKYPKDFSFGIDGRAHPGLMQAFVPTGRFAATSPNYQAMVKKRYYELSEARKITDKHIEEHGRNHEGDACECDEFEHLYEEGSRFAVNFRDFVLAPEDHYLIGFDYSNIEVRVMAGLAQEHYLINAFNNNEDAHRATASLMLSVPKEEVTKKQRARGKTLTFSTFYQQGIPALADALDVSREEAKDLQNRFFSAYSSIYSWTKKAVEEGVRNGHTVSYFGRKPKIWELQSTVNGIYAKGERACVNYPVQGMAADVAKLAMVRQDKALRASQLWGKVHLVMNVHDALEYYVHESVDPLDVIKVINPAVEMQLPKFPLFRCDWHIGYKWGSVQEIECKDGEYIIPDFRSAKEELPKTRQAVIESAVEATQPAHDSTHLIVSLTGMPEIESYKRFIARAKSVAGTVAITLETPQGSKTLPVTTGLTLADKAEISLLLGGATVRWAELSG